MIMIKKLLLFVLLLNGLIASAQYTRPENFVWAMSNKTGMDFRNGPPVMIQTNLTPLYASAHEASVTYTDATGSFFYTNGTTIWNTAGQIMPHGLRINGPGTTSESTSQGALLVPFPGAGEHVTRFYLFSLNSIDKPGNLYCNIVDMSLDNGMGDIDTTFSQYQIPIDTGLSEKLLAIPGCDGNIWVIVREKLNSVFRAYEINGNGINLTPVTSACGAYMNGGMFVGVGVLKASPDYNTLFGAYPGGLETYSFDRSTGIVSNSHILDIPTAGTYGYYGGDFSPDGTKLYVKEYGGGSGSIWQYDLSAPNPTASKTLLGLSFPLLNDIRLGPDGKIYFIAKTGYPNARFMGCIHMPNNAGPACGFQDSVMMLAFDTAHIGRGNLGSVVVFSQYRVPLNIVRDSLTLHTSNVFSSYQWYKDGDSIAGATNQYLLTTGDGWYSVKVWSANGCADSAAYEMTGSPGPGPGPGTGIIDPALLRQQVRVYPNPATDKVLLQSPVALRTALYDTKGKRLMVTGNVREIDLHALSAGLYLLYIYDNDGNRIKTEKLFVNRRE